MAQITELHHLQDLDMLRGYRNEVCFTIINRGKIWYDTLTEEQIEELRVWYNAWLDATETKIIPTQPEWLK